MEKVSVKHTNKKLDASDATLLLPMKTSMNGAWERSGIPSDESFSLTYRCRLSGRAGHGKHVKYFTMKN